MSAQKNDIRKTLNGIRKRSILGSWVSRLTTDRAPDKAIVHPCILDGRHTLVHERGLAEKDPESYRHIHEFAAHNGFDIKEDQRADFIEGIKRVRNQRRANVVSIVALTAAMMSQSLAANTTNPLDNHELVHVQKHSDHALDFDFDLNAYDSEEAMVSAMLNWINSQSSFDHDVSKVPQVKKVSATQIAKIAFGGELPQAVDPEKLQIYGLYNFNEGAVYLLDSLDMNSETGKGILLHELVHYLQYQYDQDDQVSCKNELESLAYILEAKFLQSRGHEHNISDAHIKRVSKCA